MEYWNYRIMEYWNNGILGTWFFPPFHPSGFALSTIPVFHAESDEYKIMSNKKPNFDGSLKIAEFTIGIRFFNVKVPACFFKIGPFLN